MDQPIDDSGVLADDLSRVSPRTKDGSRCPVAYAAGRGRILRRCGIRTPIAMRLVQGTCGGSGWAASAVGIGLGCDCHADESIARLLREQAAPPVGELDAVKRVDVALMRLNGASAAALQNGRLLTLLADGAPLLDLDDPEDWRIYSDLTSALPLETVAPALGQVDISPTRRVPRASAWLSADGERVAALVSRKYLA